jgi:hypothetical protein
MHYKTRPGFLTIKEAAVRYQVSRAKLHRLVRAGRVHSEKDPRDERATLLRTEDLEGFFGFPREGAEAMRYETVADGEDIVAGRLTAEACARMDAVRTRIAAKYAVWGDSVETIRAERDKRTAQITEAISGSLGGPAEDQANDSRS